MTELESVHDAYKKELARVCQKHQVELNEIEQRHRDEIKHLCAENSSEISNVKQSLKSLYETELEKIENNHKHEINKLEEHFKGHLNDLKDCDLDTLTKRIEDDITKTQAQHKKMVSNLLNENYKLRKAIKSYSFVDFDRLSSIDSLDQKLFRSNSNGHDTDIETSDYVLSQDSIENQIKDLEDIAQERDNLRSVALTLRQLTKYLCSFLITKQEELNNSIIERMNKTECSRISSSNGCGDNCAIELIDKWENNVNEDKNLKKVHFVPNIEDIVSLIDENSVLADFTNTKTNEEINHLEFNLCLKKLNEKVAQLSDAINNEHKLLYPNSEDVFHKQFFDTKLEHYKNELKKQESEYKKLFMENSVLEQENESMKEYIEKEFFSNNYKKPCNDLENDNLILLQQKAQELIKNHNEWPNLQNVFDEYLTECNKIIDKIRNEKDDLAQQLIVADSRLKSSQKFIEDQTTEREIERVEFDNKLETLKCQLKGKKRESMDTDDLRSHTEQMMTEAKDRYSMLEKRLLKTEELLSASKLEVQSLKNIILNMENQIGRYIKNETAQNDSIKRLTDMLEEEQNTQQDMMTEIKRLENLLNEQNQSDSPEFVDIEIVINKIRLQLKDVEKVISKRIKDLDTFWVSEECGSPMSEDISVAERCELPNNISIQKNSSPARIIATLDDVFIRLQERLNRLFKSEDAIFKHESDQQIITSELNKQIKSLESEVDMLRTRLTEKSDQLTTAKMKIDELRVLKNDNVNSATSQLQGKLQKMTAEFKKCSCHVEEQNHEITNLKDSTKYLKNMISIYESKLAEKENIDLNKINNLESKVIDLVEQNMNLQIELKTKISQIELLTTQFSNLQNKELSQNVGGKQNHSVSKSIMTDTQISENEQMRRAIPNESNPLASLQMSYNHQDASVHVPSMLNLSLHSPLTEDNTNMQNSISDELKLALANTKLELEEKNSLIKVMEKNAERLDHQLMELKETIKILNSENFALENLNQTLVKNEAELINKFNNVVIQLEKKQETLTELETLGVKLKAEIQPLEYMKDNLEKKISAFKDCNKIQSERIECLENINEELKNECDRLKTNQTNLNEIKSLQQDNWILKNELLNTEKFKLEVSEKLEELKNEYDLLKSKNLTLMNDIKNLNLDKDCLKKELEKNEELHTDELIGYQKLLAEEQNKKHQVNMELLKAFEELTNHTSSEQQKFISDIQENTKFEVTCTLSDFGSENTTSNLAKNSIEILEIDLENERKKNSNHQRHIEDKDAEIEYLNTIKKFQEEKMADYMHKIQVESDRNTELELHLTKLENHIRELENKIEIFKTQESNQANNYLVEKLENDLAKVLNTNEMLDNELTRILDIKEETDKKLIDACNQIVEFETCTGKLTALLGQLENKNHIIETFKLQLNNAEMIIKDQQVRADKNKQLLELKLLDLQKELKDCEQKYNELVNEYEVMKNYVIKTQQITDSAQLAEKNVSVNLKLEVAEKNVTEWQKKYTDLLYENREIKNKFESLDAECCHLQNKITELQNKLTLSDHYKNKLKNDIQDIPIMTDFELRNSKLIVNLETENLSLIKKLTETREKYNKCRVHLEEIKSLLVKQNFKSVIQENINLCKTRNELQKEVSDLKCRNQDLSRKILEKGENYWPVIDNNNITRVEALYHSLVWQKMYLVRLARGKDKLLRFIIQEWPDLDNNIIKTTIQKICAKRKMSKFKIAAISIIAVRRMRLIAMKRLHPRLDLTQSQFDLTHYSLPRKMPWIKC